jgi:2-polyprenyl-6-methoxyphenol hydroxylase-like FAD-dependent oxidoreductase
MHREAEGIIVGGGLAGLAAAVSLAQAGWRTTVLERASAFGEVGAGLALPRNGIAALHALGFDDATINRIGHETNATGFRDTQGRRILRIPEEKPFVRWATTIWGVHRQRLHAALLDAARTVGVGLVDGAEVTDVHAGSPHRERARVTWRSSSGNHSADAGLVVGADGMWSAVRGSLFPQVQPTYAGSTSWRAVIPDTTLDGRLVELWGPGTEFGAIRVAEDEVYWYGYFRHPERASFENELAAAQQKFADWHPRVRAIIGATAESQLMRHDVYHLPGGLPSYVRGRVVMIGDAAHAALPTAGQGAATALEDGVCVGRLVGGPVAAGGDIGIALQTFDSVRRPRCRRIARQAALTARVGADLPGGWRQQVRNALARAVPAGVLAKAGAPVVGWTPPHS